MYYVAFVKLAGLFALLSKNEKNVRLVSLIAYLVALVGAIATIFIDSTLTIPYLFEEGISFNSDNGVIATSLSLAFLVYFLNSKDTKLNTALVLFMESFSLSLVYANDLFTSYICLMALIFVTFFAIRKTKYSTYYLAINIFGSLIMLFGMFMTNHYYHSLDFNLVVTGHEFITYGLIVLGLALSFIFPFAGVIARVNNPLVVLTSASILTLIYKVMINLNIEYLSLYFLISALILAFLAFLSKNNAINYSFVSSVSLVLAGNSMSMQMLISVIILAYSGLTILANLKLTKANRLIFVFLSLSATGIAFAGFTGFGMMYLSLANMMFVAVIANGLILASLIRYFMVHASNEKTGAVSLLLNLVLLLVLTSPILYEGIEFKISAATSLALPLTLGVAVVGAIISRKIAFDFKFSILDNILVPLIKFISDLLALVARLLSDVVEAIVYVVRRLFFNMVNTRINIKGNKTFTVYDEDAKYGKIFHEDLEKSLLLISIGIALAMLYMVL